MFPLMDIVPVIVIDARFLSASLAEEISRIGNSPPLSGKSVVLAHPSQEFEIHTLARFVPRTFSEDRLQHVVANKFGEWRNGRRATSAA